MLRKIYKKYAISCLLTLIFFVTISGCKTTEKDAEKPNRFEKWRIMAEESKGHTATPQDYDLGIEENDSSIQSEGIEPIIYMENHKKHLPKIPITMTMHDVPVAVLLRTLARAADMNIMINETVTGNAKINIRKIPWDQAFNGLLKTYGLTYNWAGSVLRVITVEDLNKEIALMEAEQKFEKSKKEHAIAMLNIQKAEEKLNPLVTRIIKVDYADLSSLRDNLELYLLAIKKDIDSAGNQDKAPTDTGELRGSILMDENSSSLILQATSSEIKQIIPIIKQLDQPNAQVLIEAHIVEANSDTAKELGVQWGGLGLNTSTGNNTWLGGPMGNFDDSLLVSSEGASETVPAGSPITHLPSIGTGANFPSSEKAGTADWQGMTVGLMTQSIGKYMLYAQLTALEKEGELNILSHPSITTMDHRKATIESGKEVPFQSIEDGQVKIEFKKAVIKLEVTPHVINNQVIRLDILTHKDELDWTTTVAGNPTIITKNAETRVNLYDGQTTVIGGLNKEKTQVSEKGVPMLKDLPGVGTLFKSSGNSSEMEELLIFITPHILKVKTPDAKSPKQ